MEEIRQHWTVQVLNALSKLAVEMSVETRDFQQKLCVGKPPKTNLGDISYALFPFSKDFKIPPQILAEKIAVLLGGPECGVNPEGPYINICINRQKAIADILSRVVKSGEKWGSGDELSGRKVMIEFSSPNTNKPLHLGHLRNDILGESCCRILSARGAEVQKVNLVNDRGIHICKSMIAYKKYRDGQTPESLGVKSDKFVGDLYVKYTAWASEDKNAENAAQRMLQSWESGDKDTRDLWEKMNRWALDGINATYKRTGIVFDRYYRESETYLLGKKIIDKGLSDGVFFRHEDGSIRLDMSEIGLDRKVFLRSDGTSVYITQDLGTAVSRHKDWPFDQLIYVVGNEQEYHFKVLFFALKKLGYRWADLLRHLSYGMINLPEGRMKSREGTVVDADDLLDSLAELALKEIQDKGRQNDVADLGPTAEKIALAALHYHLLNVSPVKDMVFDTKKSLSFNGNTGPYLQYVLARIAGLKGKFSPDIANNTIDDFDSSHLIRDDEWEIVQKIDRFPHLVSRASEKLDPSVITAGLYEIARDFSHYYHEVPIAKVENPQLATARMHLITAVEITLKNGLYLLNIPWMKAM